MQKLVITGVERSLGAGLAAALADRFAVVGLYDAAEEIKLGGEVSIEPCVLDNPQAVVASVADHAPDWVIHCGRCARASWDAPEGASCAAEPEIARRLAESAAERGGKLTVISTDAVYCGPRLFHEETETAGAAGPLADAARAMEAALADTPALVVRTCAYGWSPTSGSMDWAERLWTRLREDDPAAIDAERHATPIFAADLADLLAAAFRQGLTGLYHITGGERTSMLRFALELASVAGLHSTAHIEPLAPSDADAAAVQGETSLGTRRARRQLKAAMPLLREGVERFVRERDRVADHLTNGESRQVLAAGRAA